MQLTAAPFSWRGPPEGIGPTAGGRGTNTLTTSTNSVEMHEILQSVFGFSRFRANQEAVCRAAIAGRDLLLVMPTGAGKSLCYQLPAIARAGTALVISPLIALMDDQAAKLASLGLRVARIHSGLDRAVARQACIDYLQGSLQFLFIAPERLRVPGFKEMLAKRPLALIAIDEAHCISQWGHDFRPDYRMIGQYLPALRPAPVIALTATATPIVQADILTQLGMEKPARFIHGFRRSNLGIEVAEVPMPDRPTVITSLLVDPRRRPAIVYATSRKMAEKLAEELSLRVPAAAYHAGLDPDRRERVQTAFMAGELEIVVATIAFGMGIDKADIRTVIHAGLPATLEGYYQEIGRAGRDGKPSRTYLMHSYADHRTHDFFLTRDYPPANVLDRIFHATGEDPLPIEELREVARLGEEEFDKALEKLEIHGGVRVDFGGYVTRGAKDWKKTYTAQASFRAEQFAKVLQFTESSDCRMASLIRHFGDVEDAVETCAACDVCDPGGAVIRQFRRAKAPERAMVQQIVDELRPVEYKAAGTLQRSIDPSGRLRRDEFYALLDAMTRAGLIAVEDAEYEKDGEVKRYRKVRLTPQGLELRPTTPVEILLSDGLVEEFANRSTARAGKPKSASARPAPKNGSGSSGVYAPASRKESAPPVRLTAEGERVAAKLKEWRTAEAKRLRIPAYLLLNDRTIASLAQARPKNPNQLLQVDGIGPAKAEKFGDTLLGLCN